MGISPAIIAAGVGAAGSIGGGLLGASGAEQAAQTAANTQMAIFDKTQQNLSPFINMGQGAMTQLSGLLGLGPNGINPAAARNAQSLVQNLPGYQFQLNQGIQAVDRSAASRGLSLSGGQLKDLTGYGQGYAQNAWNSYLGQLTGLAGMGESAAAGQGQIGATTGANIGQAQLTGGLAGTDYMMQGYGGALQNSLLGYNLYAQNQPYSGGGYANNNLGGSQSGDLASMFQDYNGSDVRLKTDIRGPVGKTNDGIGVYLFRYRADPRKVHMGVMAQEVERTRPDAVRTHPSGFKLVNYSKLSTPLKEAA